MNFYLSHTFHCRSFFGDVALRLWMTFISVENKKRTEAYAPAQQVQFHYFFRLPVT